MSDDPTLPEGNSGEAASAAEGSPPPWGDDFNPERAWRTIEHLRGRERELESDAKAFKRLHEDEDAQREWLTQMGYEIADDAEEDIPEYDDEVGDNFDDDDDDDPNAQRIARLEAEAEERRARDEQQNAERQIGDFRDHLDELAGEEELSQEEVEWIFNRSLNNGFSPKATEEAFEAHRQWMDGLRQKAIEEYRTSKRAPHFSSSGQSASKAPNLDDPRERQEWMAERAAALERDQ